MTAVSILKLGGSIVTDKRRARAVIRIRVVKRIAGELARLVSRQPNLRLIVLYGGGSFGHPLARRYRLAEKPLAAENFVGVGHTIAAMRELGTRLAGLFLAAGLPVVPLQTSSLVRRRRGKLVFADRSLVATILRHGGIPLLGGDVVIAEGRQTAIASADALAAALAMRFRRRRILFATDVDGVYPRFPPRRGERPLRLINRRLLRRLTAALKAGQIPRDVTGAMGGKLRAIAALESCSVEIFNGTVPGAITDVFRKKRRGTVIEI